ncbi:MAG: sigma-54-dependent Fis family transcriptional regulator, partial [Polyangiales bacterium]
RGEPAVVPTIGEEPLFLDRTGARKNLDRTKIAFLCAPIAHRGEIVGTLSVDRVYGSAVSLEDDLRLLQIIAMMIGQSVRQRRDQVEEVESLKRENARLAAQQRARAGTSLIGSSSPMQAVIEMVHQVAPSEATVLIRGESGTGKELVARALHFAGRRASRAFMPVNCGALVGTLLDSELFGHVRGAFTGADTAKRGLFLAADGGTLFLDEIGELPIELQPKLLRALQDGEVKAVGGTSSIRVDARVVAATNRALEEACKSGTFREDLYYRLAVITLEVPPLRNRPGDIPLLARHFVEQAALRAERSRPHITDAALAHLAAQAWPGNVRELENTIERAVILGTGDVLDIADVQGQRPATAATGLTTFTGDHIPTLDELERTHILRVLELCEQQKTKAAAMLGINRTTLWKKLRQYGIEGV